MVSSLCFEALVVEDRGFRACGQRTGREHEYPVTAAATLFPPFGDYELTIVLTTASFDEDQVSSVLVV